MSTSSSDKILNYLTQHPEQDHHVSDIARKVNFTYLTVRKYILNLKALGKVKQTRTFGNCKMYQTIDWVDNKTLSTKLCSVCNNEMSLIFFQNTIEKKTDWYCDWCGV